MPRTFCCLIILTATGKSVGDSVTFGVGGKLVTAKIVGQIFETRNDGLYMVTDWPTLSHADHSLGITRWQDAERVAKEVQLALS